MRARRLAAARPVSEWLTQERERVATGALAPEVKLMYDSAIKLSPRFAAEFASFWGLESGFTFKTGDEQ